MKRIRNVNPLAALALIALAGVAVYAFTAGDSQAVEAKAEPVVRWQYAIIRLEGVDHGKREAAIAQLNRYGASGWEAVELLPPAYDILMKRPVQGSTAPATGEQDSGRE